MSILVFECALCSYIRLCFATKLFFLCFQLITQTKRNLAKPTSLFVDLWSTKSLEGRGPLSPEFTVTVSRTFLALSFVRPYQVTHSDDQYTSLVTR